MDLTEAKAASRTLLRIIRGTAFLLFALTALLMLSSLSSAARKQTGHFADPLLPGIGAASPASTSVPAPHQRT